MILPLYNIIVELNRHELKLPSTIHTSENHSCALITISHDFYESESEEVFNFSRNCGFLNTYKMFESLSAEIKVLSAKITAKMPPDISNMSITTVSPNSLNNPSQFPVVPFSPKLPPAVIEAVNDDMKLHSSIRDSVKVMNSTNSMEFLCLKSFE
ncbi:hypothetical protein ACTXT7_016709 [Hymenolepis weldensis]